MNERVRLLRTEIQKLRLYLYAERTIKGLYFASFIHERHIGMVY